MKQSLASNELADYVTRQIETLFPDNIPLRSVRPFIEPTLERLEYCFSHNTNKYYTDNGSVRFSHLHSDQYATFIYLLSNTIFKHGGDRILCDKLFCLNKLLHGLNVYYEVELPRIFFLTHPLGTVLGRAHYEDFLFVYQGCTVGNNHGKYPTIGKHVTIYTGASILGDSHVGNACKIAVNSVLLDTDLPDNSIYIGSPANHSIKPNKSIAHVWNH